MSKNWGSFNCGGSSSATAAKHSARVLRTGLYALLLAAGLPFAAQAQTCVPGATADWMATSDQLAAPIRPAECASVEQSPPDFGWPDVSSNGAYQVTLTYPDGHAKTLAAAQNWINWNKVLPAGSYSWQVQVIDSSGIRISRARQFTVGANATPFLMPDAATLLNRVTAEAHPRGLPDPTTLALMLGDRQSAVSALASAVNSQLSSALPGAPSGLVESQVRDECMRTLNSLMAYIYTKQDIYFNDALRRVLNLASWDPGGSTSYANAAQASRQIAWTLTLAYDWLYLGLDTNQRSLLIAAILARGTDMYNDIIGLRARIAKYPRDSQGNRTLVVLGVISTLLAGDLSQANTWLQGSLPLAINATNPWGSEEGGFADADAFGTWNVGELLVPWYLLRWSAGVDLSQKAWVRNWSRFIAYFLPPGTPSGVFGDGAEQTLGELWARLGKGYTHFAPTSLGRWYASQLTGEDPTRMEYLLSPLADLASNVFPDGTPSSAAFLSLGQAAMHSDLADAARTSVYFKSSPAPYGSFDHSHADQNSFVVSAGGQRLAIDSGYYDGYKTAHWLQWYKQTRAHNAVTFDGGQGQLFFEQDGKMGYGAITNYALNPDHDIVHGDAMQAYGGALTEAKRSMVYLRPNLVLVYDRLASNTPRQWEWNIHALNPMNVVSDRQISIENNGQRLCVDMLAGPTMRFTQTDQFTAAPIGNLPSQWHGNFYSVDLLGAAEFIALLNVGCTATTASAGKTSGVWTVLVGDKIVTISDTGISVGAAAISASTPASAPTTTLISATTTVTSALVTPSPYSGVPIALPGTFEAENFDKGGEGIAYHDLTPGNCVNACSGPAAYRLTEDVDIIASSDTAYGSGYMVTYTQTGEWLAYTINVATSSNYDIELRAATNFDFPNAAYHVEIDGVNVTGSVVLPDTGGWSNFQWVGKKTVPLTAGNHVLKFVIDGQYFNLNSIRVLSSAKLLFSSSFEGATALNLPANCWQTTVGADSTTGFTWPANIWGGSISFQLIPGQVISCASVGNYMANRIVTVTGHAGNQTQALYSEITQRGDNSTQNVFLLQPASEQGDLYVAYWLKYQADLLAKMTPQTWRSLFEWKTAGDYRVGIYVASWGDGCGGIKPLGPLFWQIQADNNANGGLPFQSFWRVDNCAVAVPVDQWFKFEVFWHRSAGTDGRVWVAVNGQVLADHRGPNMGVNNAAINRIFNSLVYSDSSYPIYQWTDDLEIWDGFPPVTGNNPPYAPH